MVLHLGSQINHFVNAYVAYISLKMVVSRGFTKVWLEGNSLNIINCLKEKYTPSWMINRLFLESINILNLFNKYKVTHVFWEGNYVTDRLESLGVHYQIMLSWGINYKILEEIKMLIHNNDKDC